MLVHATASRLPFRDGSIHFGITSPPYFGLRSYDGIAPQVWGGVSSCRHEWGDEGKKVTGRRDQDRDTRHTDGRDPSTQNLVGCPQQEASTGQFCIHCGAWFGHLGNEPTPAMFVANLVTVGREMMRVLHPQGVWILNLGDSFAGGGRGSRDPDDKLRARGMDTRPDDGFKPKDKMLIPHRVIMALQESGWYVRQEMPWVKFNPMPESTTDRPTTAHEYLFLLTKSERYFWDGEGVKQQASTTSHGAPQPNPGQKQITIHQNHNGKLGQTPEQAGQVGRQLRTTDIWLSGLDALIAEQQAYLDHLLQIRNDGGLLVDQDGNPMAVRVASQPYSGAHYACFPPALIEPLIKGGTSEKGVCPVCGRVWERVVEKTVSFESGSGKAGNKPVGKYNGTEQAESGSYDIRMGPVTHTSTISWRPTCDCRIVPDDDGKLRYPQPVAPIVLDCFTGSGTTGEVCATLTAQGHPLRFVGVDLSAEYLSKHASLRAENKVTTAALAEAEKRAKDRYAQEKRPGKEVQDALKAGQTSLF